jgi:hypothetical protein
MSFKKRRAIKRIRRSQRIIFNLTHEGEHIMTSSQEQRVRDLRLEISGLSKKFNIEVRE